MYWYFYSEFMPTLSTEIGKIKNRETGNFLPETAKVHLICQELYTERHSGRLCTP